MIIIRSKLTTAELEKTAENRFGNMIKAVVDIQRRIMAIDAELHSDEEAMLIEDGSRQMDLWGINVYPEFDKNSPDFVEFDSMINLRPSQGNRSRGVDNLEIRNTIITIVKDLTE